MSADPLTDVDWPGHWRRLVEEREREVPIDPALDFWAPTANRLKFDPQEAGRDPLLLAMEPFLGPRKTAIDVGAGAGRHAVPLADRLDWVTAVEPSQGMRDAIPPRDNLTVVASGWEDAEVAPADLVLSAHVLYFVPDPQPFIEKLERSARERVFVMLRNRPIVTPSEHLFAVLAGRPRRRMPHAYDLWNLLQARGVDADVSFVGHEMVNVYDDLEEAAAECRLRLGRVWREEEGRAWLAEHLTAREDGKLTYGGPMVAGIVQWTPSSS